MEEEVKGEDTLLSGEEECARGLDEGMVSDSLLGSLWLLTWIKQSSSVMPLLSLLVKPFMDSSIQVAGASFKSSMVLGDRTRVAVKKDESDCEAGGTNVSELAPECS